MSREQPPPNSLAQLRHELRTALNAIIGYSEMLLEDAEEVSATPPEFLDGLRSLEASGRDLLGFVNKSLDPMRLGTSPLDWQGMRADLRLGLATPADMLTHASEQLLAEAQAGGSASDVLLSDLEKVRLAAANLSGLLGGFLNEAPPPEAPPAKLGPGRLAPAGSRHVQRGSILVVDDDEANRDLLIRHLQRQGHRATPAADGLQALEALRAGRFDLVLLDVMMPEMDGYQTLEKMKGDPALRDVPVIMISALDEIDSVARCIELGAEDYLPKPFDPVLLRARIEAGLEKKRLRDQEMEYLENVRLVTAAAAAVEANRFDLASLDAVSTRADALGQLARVFQRMAREVHEREERLRQQVQDLSIEIDEVRRARQVAEITETNYFQTLQEKARRLRERRATTREDGPASD
jgi:CheY-like chemotaxis protein